MTQPTQELPPYLSASTFVVTSDGVVSTGVSTVEVPLTYFGPSIPLGPGDVWVFGGSTSPPSTTETTTAIPSSSSSSTPLSSSTTSLTSQTSSSSSSLPSVTSSTSATLSGSSTTSSAPVSSGSPSIPASTSRSTVRRALPGIIIGSIIGFLLILALIVYLLYRRNRRYRTYDQANLSDFVLVDSDGQTRIAGEGVARPTGGEEDPFLSREGLGAEAVVEQGEAITTDSAVPAAESRSGGEPSQPTPMSQVRSIFKGNSLFAGSGASIFYNPNAPVEQPVPSDAQHRPLRDSSSTHPSSIPSATPPPPPPPRGPIMPARQLIDLDAEWQKEPHEEFVDTPGPSLPPGLPARPAYPQSPVISEHGERLTNPSSENLRRISAVLGPDVSVEAAGSRGVRFNPDGSFQTSAPNRSFRSSGMSAMTTDPADESFSFPSARRVILSETAPGQYVTLPPSAPQSRRISALSFGSFARLSPLSWLQSSANSRSRSRPRNQSRPGSAIGRPLTDAELQAGRTILMASRPGDRPVSYVSAHSVNSGNSVYHDAASTFSSRGQSRPTTPAAGSTPTPPPPAVPPVPSPPPPIATSTPLRPDFDVTSTSIPNPSNESLSAPAPGVPTALRSSGDMENPSGVTIDILDTPAPPSISPYSSTSSRNGPAVPPGLGPFTAPRVWRESSSDMPPPASLGSGQSDYLEDEPPRAGDGWTNLRTTVGSERRTTLGQPVVTFGSPAQSEIASLHSIPSRRSPLASSASGSNPHLVSPHSRYNSASISSGSSRPSLHSHVRSVNTSGSSSLAHSNSISSDGRRGARRHVGEPPAVQYAIGSSRPRLSALGGRSAMSSPPHSPPTVPEATFAAALGAASTITTDDTSSARSGSLATTTTTTMVDTQTGAVMHFPTVVWTSGREVDWPSDAWTEIPDSGGARWWGPPHRLQAFQRAAGDRRQRTAMDDLQRYT